MEYYLPLGTALAFLIPLGIALIAAVAWALAERERAQHARERLVDEMCDRLSAQINRPHTHPSHPSHPSKDNKG